jgi:alkyldihydroxyacetonephosphate synthase
MMKWWGWGDPNLTFPMADKPNLWPWVVQKLGITSAVPTVNPVDLDSIKMPPTRAGVELLAELQAILEPGQISLEPLDRLHHSYGKSFPDLFRVRNGVVRRAPDAVLLPDSHEQVEALVKLAQQLDVCLIPFGGAR